MSAAFNGWTNGNTVHWPATYNRMVPLCVEAAARRGGLPLPKADPESPTWHEAIPQGHAICDDDALSTSCPDCIEWRRA